jgi:hypothetical protein
MYPIEQRQIFGPYWNGQARVYGDPVRLKRRLDHAARGELPKWIERWNDPSHPQHHEALDALLGAARWAMELVPFDPATGSGATDDEAEFALRQLLEWLEGKGPRAETSPTSSRPTATSGVGPSPTTSGCSSY